MSNDPLKKIVIDHRSKTPITEQLEQQIETLIQNNEMIALDSLPSARALSKQLSIKQKDVEATYKMLEQKQYIEFHHKDPIVKYFERVMDFFTNFKTIEEAINKMGLLPNVEVISINIENLKLPIQLESSETRKPYIVMKRIYYANETPIIYMEDFYPCDRYPDIEKENFKNVKSFYKDILLIKYEVNITKTKRYIQITEIPPLIDKLLSIPKKQAVIQADMIYYDHDNKVIAYGTGYTIPSYYFQTFKEEIL
jgi:DNA-binding GntR family transcriptional regulator